VKTLLIKPQTFYNESGRAVGEAVKFYKLTSGQCGGLLRRDRLAPGRFRMKTGGGAAGNNGVRSIAGRIGPDFRRARLGTGHPGDKDMVQHHVLRRLPQVELPWVEAYWTPAPRPCAAGRGGDEKYQTEVLRLAPAKKADVRLKPPR